METTPLNLKQYGIDVGLLISGLFGAILLTSKGSAMNLTRTISSLVGGAASANYITPIVINVAKLNGEHFHYGIAFLLGYLGLRSVEFFSNKLIPNSFVSEESEVNPITKRRRSRNSRLSNKK